MFTWDSSEKLDSISVPVETELSVSHGAIGNEGPCCHFVAAVVPVDANYASWMVPRCLGDLTGCEGHGHAQRDQHLRRRRRLHFANVRSLPVRGIEMMTPLPVPIHRRLHDTIREVILTKEKPSFPVPERQDRRWSPSRGLVVRYWPIRTEHFADVGLDVDVLKVLAGVSMEQPERGVQPYGHPDAVAIPGQETHLTVLTGVGVK